VCTGRNGGLNENISKLRHGPNAFELLKLALSTLFASFCQTFGIAIVMNLLTVTEVGSNQRFSNINLACVRLNENTSGPDLLARFMRWFVQSENNHLNVVINAQLTLCEMVMARMIFNGNATSVALPHLVGSPGVQALHRSGPREPRIEGYLCLTQEQLASSSDIFVLLAALLTDHGFRGATILTAVGEELSGTNQRRFSFSAEHTFFDHPNIGVARTDPGMPMVKALATDREYICAVSGSTVMWIRFTYSGKRNDARAMIRRKAAAAKRSVEAARGAAMTGSARIPAHVPDALADAAADGPVAGTAAATSPTGVDRGAPAVGGPQQPSQGPRLMAGQPHPHATEAAAVGAGTGLWLQPRPAGRGRGSPSKSPSAAVVRSNGFAALGGAAEAATGRPH
jgi:hypothetical protein